MVGEFLLIQADQEAFSVLAFAVVEEFVGLGVAFLGGFGEDEFHFY